MVTVCSQIIHYYEKNTENSSCQFILWTVPHVKLMLSSCFAFGSKRLYQSMSLEIMSKVWAKPASCLHPWRQSRCGASSWKKTSLCKVPTPPWRFFSKSTSNTYIQWGVVFKKCDRVLSFPLENWLFFRATFPNRIYKKTLYLRCESLPKLILCWVYLHQ